MNCNNCKKIVDVEDNYCGNCGFKIEYLNRCSKCGDNVEVDDKFCGSCGFNLKTTTTNFFKLNKTPIGLIKSSLKVTINLILILFLIPFFFVSLNYLVFGKPNGPLSAIGAFSIINFIIFGLANRSIALQADKNTTIAFWLGILGPLGMIICLINCITPSRNKILLGIGRFTIWAVFFQLMKESNTSPVFVLITLYLGFLFILRGKNFYKYR